MELLSLYFLKLIQNDTVYITKEKWCWFHADNGVTCQSLYVTCSFLYCTVSKNVTYDLVYLGNTMVITIYNVAITITKRCIIRRAIRKLWLVDADLQTFLSGWPVDSFFLDFDCPFMKISIIDFLQNDSAAVVSLRHTVETTTITHSLENNNVYV